MYSGINLQKQNTMHTQVFKGETLTYTRTKNNILRMWDQTETEDRQDWYDKAFMMR